MSMQVPLNEVESAATDHASVAFVLVSSAEGPPRVTHSSVRFESGAIVATVGRRSTDALAVNPAVTVLWPANASQSMSLIVDGIVDDVVADPTGNGGGEIRIAPTGAVRHRPAPG